MSLNPSAAWPEFDKPVTADTVAMRDRESDSIEVVRSKNLRLRQIIAEKINTQRALYAENVALKEQVRALKEGK